MGRAAAYYFIFKTTSPSGAISSSAGQPAGKCRENALAFELSLKPTNLFSIPRDTRNVVPRYTVLVFE